MNSPIKTSQPLTYFCGPEAIDYLARFCLEKGLESFVLVADRNTWPILGQMVEQMLLAQGHPVRHILLSDEPVVAGEAAITEILLGHTGQPVTFLAVGSGTITDLTRFVSHRTGCPFISIPTAPSVDGYTSAHAPLILNGFKKTIAAQPPLAIFAHLPTLCTAPPAMIAAGFGDLLGKITALADWQLGRLLWDEPYQTNLAEQTRQALDAGLQEMDAIAAATPEGIRALMDALVISGQSMLLAGGSWPASGAEHHLAHFWEMRWLQNGHVGRLHGEKVGVATRLVADLYAQVRAIPSDEAAQRLQATPWPKPGTTQKEIQSIFGPLAGQAILSQRRFLDLDAPAQAQIRQRIQSCWPEIQTICVSVPPPQQITDWLQRVGAPVYPGDLGLDSADTELGLQYADCLRDRFTILKLLQWLGLPRRLRAVID